MTDEADPAHNWTYSSDEEEWNGCSTSLASREEAIAEAESELALEPGDTYWTGRAVPITAEMIAAGAPDGSSILESLDSYIYDNWGGDDPLVASDEATTELSGVAVRAVREWLVKYGISPARYTITDAESHVYEPAQPTCSPQGDFCPTHGKNLVCSHVCPDGLCFEGCEDKTDREIKRAAGAKP